MTIATKSRSNTPHGTLFEYLQNKALDATPFGFESKAPEELQYVWRQLRRAHGDPCCARRSVSSTRSHRQFSGSDTRAPRSGFCLLVGRMPEYLGKKIDAFDVKMAMLSTLAIV